MVDFKILVGNKGYVDFDQPVKMNEKESEQFIQLLKNIFDLSIIEINSADEFRDWRISDKILYPRTWTAEEYEVLLKSSSTHEAVEKLGRSDMAVIVQDGIWRPDFLSWCEKKGKNPFAKDIIPTIKEYIKENEDIKIKKREKCKAPNKIQEIAYKIQRIDEKAARLLQKYEDRDILKFEYDWALEPLNKKKAELLEKLEYYKSLLSKKA